MRKVEGLIQMIYTSQELSMVRMFSWVKDRIRYSRHIIYYFPSIALNCQPDNKILLDSSTITWKYVVWRINFEWILDRYSCSLCSRVTIFPIHISGLKRKKLTVSIFTYTSDSRCLIFKYPLVQSIFENHTAYIKHSK